MPFNPKFLQTDINTPQLNNSEDAFKLNDSEVIDYIHFSLALHSRTKFAIWVAWNIDGRNLKRIPRKGSSFFEDSRIPSENQAGNKLYKSNPLDRGHLARRVDLNWGSYAEAKKANSDSFVFTNIAPQMDSFNQSGKGGVWGELENSLYDQTEMDQSRVSIIGGCIFHEDDREYRGYKIPTEFYKTIMYEEKGKLKTKSFILTQDLTRLSFLDLEAFKTYEVAPSEIEAKCNFTFDEAIHQANEFDLNSFIPTERQPLNVTSEINW
ncbi:DNA/RNA non-specific endonuclease [Zobellia amurskyensis]|uniref:DNA/RNA non-specific endonuclease n=1 Tax=Zobellia amurskyensis TaxID=248905 RepID=A0A7X2ZRU1_9FLAO|nr:DNA/RNA non-specific endonuclease [Zobellia amurskyensis]MUH35245.1 DNA/RNA non-specific endonuclease [Zobellia amurskyensis]